MVGAVKPFSEVNFMLLILVVRVRIVEDIVCSTDSRCCRSCWVETHRHWPSNRASCRDGLVKIAPVLMRRIHTYVRCVLCRACRMAQPTRVTTLASNANHGVRIGNEATLCLPLLLGFNTAQVVLSDISDSTHVLNLNNLVHHTSSITGSHQV